MKRLLLVQPKYENEKLDRNVKTIYPLGLGYLAAYVPETWDVNIVDEQIKAINYDEPVDMVGISVTTLTANRAYKISQEFRKRGITTILGGVHVSMCTEEAKRYCDTVCIGDGEGVIAQILTDFENKTLKTEYHGAQPPLEGLKQPRRDLFSNDYTFLPVSTSRGCPFNCHFCCINRFYKGKYRKRDVEEVIQEMINLPKGHDVVFITDGNMPGYLEKDIDRFMDICRRITEERKKGNIPFKYFTCYASVNVLDNEKALEAASKAGCVALFIGFESINPDALKEMNKVLNLKYGVDTYNELVARARKHNLLIVGEMMVGNDADTLETLKETEKFIDKVNFDILRLQIVQPLPGTKLYSKLEEEGRLYLKNFPEDWDKLRDGFLVGINYKMKQIEANVLQKWVKRVGLKFYSPEKIILRGLKNLIMTRNPRMALTTILMNWKSRKSYANLDL